jgi:hypothetical protein
MLRIPHCLDSLLTDGGKVASPTTTLPHVPDTKQCKLDLGRPHTQDYLTPKQRKFDHLKHSTAAQFQPKKEPAAVAVNLKDLQTKLCTWRWPVGPKLVAYLNICNEKQKNRQRKTDKIYQNSDVRILYVEFTHINCHPKRLPLWSGGQSSWLQIRRPGFDSRRYQIFWEAVGLERGPLSLVSAS